MANNSPTLVRTYYRRHLPHYQVGGAVYHVVFRLAGSLPDSAIVRLQAERKREEERIAGLGDARQRSDAQRDHQERYFDRFEDILHGSSTGPRWLEDPRIADLVAEAIRFKDGSTHTVVAYCVMPNHVHLLLSVAGNQLPLHRILQSLKRYTSRHANLLLGRTGAFWQHESYDHVVRSDEELVQTVAYILGNPVKAGLVSTAAEWRWSYSVYGL